MADALMVLATAGAARAPTTLAAQLVEDDSPSDDAGGTTRTEASTRGQRTRCVRPMGLSGCLRRARLPGDAPLGDRALGCRCCTCEGCSACTGSNGQCTRSTRKLQARCNMCLDRRRRWSKSAAVAEEARAAESTALIQQAFDKISELQQQTAVIRDEASYDPDDSQRVRPPTDPRDPACTGVLYTVRHEVSVGNELKRKWVADGQAPSDEPNRHFDWELSRDGRERLEPASRVHAQKILDLYQRMSPPKQLRWLVSPMRRALETADALHTAVKRGARKREVEIHWGGCELSPLVVECGGVQWSASLSLRELGDSYTWLKRPWSWDECQRIDPDDGQLWVDVSEETPWHLLADDRDREAPVHKRPGLERSDEMLSQLLDLQGTAPSAGRSSSGPHADAKTLVVMVSHKNFLEGLTRKLWRCESRLSGLGTNGTGFGHLLGVEPTAGGGRRLRCWIATRVDPHDNRHAVEDATVESGVTTCDDADDQGEGRGGVSAFGEV